MYQLNSKLQSKYKQNGNNTHNNWNKSMKSIQEMFSWFAMVLNFPFFWLVNIPIKQFNSKLCKKYNMFIPSPKQVFIDFPNISPTWQHRIELESLVLAEIANRHLRCVQLMTPMTNDDIIATLKQETDKRKSFHKCQMKQQTCREKISIKARNGSDGSSTYK